MTHAQPEDTRQLIENLARQQANTQQQLDSFIETATSVLARSAVLDGVVLELRESTENLQHNFEQHQRNLNSTNVTLRSINGLQMLHWQA